MDGEPAAALRWRPRRLQDDRRWPSPFKDGRISRTEYESGDPRARARVGNKTFDDLDVNQDAVLTADDFRLILKSRLQQILSAVERQDDDWIWTNFFRVGARWIQQHREVEPNRTRILRLDLPVFLFHGTDDANCPVQGVIDIGNRARERGRTSLCTFIVPDHDHACGLGVCGCVLSALGPSEVVASATAQAPDQRLAFARYQVAKMVGFMAVGPAAPACTEILENTGRECSKLGGLAAKFKGDPEGYFATAKRNWGTEFSWDKEKGIISVAEAEGECGCPLVDSKRPPRYFCNCSVGYQKESFETVFGRPVRAALKESKLGGSTRCVFEVTLA